MVIDQSLTNLKNIFIDLSLTLVHESKLLFRLGKLTPKDIKTLI